MSGDKYKRILESLGVSEIWPPKHIHRNHLFLGEHFSIGRKLLIVVLYCPEPYLREVRTNIDLMNIVNGPYCYRFFELTEEQTKNLNEALVQPHQHAK